MVKSSRPWNRCAFGLLDDIVRAIRNTEDDAQLRALTRAFADDMGCRYFAILTHEDLRSPRPGAVDLRDYAEGATRRIVGEGRYRRDPVMRGCLFAEAAFLWSSLPGIIPLDHHDRLALELGRREGLNEGITVPCAKLGACFGSCTFAGLKSLRHAEMLLGPAQAFGTFAFQQARRFAGPSRLGPPPRLEPRHRECILLSGQGYKDKLIAHRLGLTVRTVESYMRDARHLLGASDRTELLAAAILAGEIGTDELRPSRTVNSGR
jgi:LuxR family quorum-sensing system transcriptional regulator CciR